MKLLYLILNLHTLQGHLQLIDQGHQPVLEALQYGQIHGFPDVLLVEELHFQ